MSTTAGFDNVTAELHGILSDERALLLAGRAAEASQLMQDKLAALEAFEAWIGSHDAREVSPRQRQAIQAITELASENRIHFSAVRNGLRSAISRIQGSSEESYVGAYRLDGAKTPFSKATGNYQKKV